MTPRKPRHGKDKITSRSIALKIIKRVEKHSAFAGRLLDEAISKENLDDRDRRLLYELVMGTLRWQGKIDHALAQLSDILCSE